MGGKGIDGRGAGVPGIGRRMLGGWPRSGTKEAGECTGTGRLEGLSKEEERKSANCSLMMGRKGYVMDMIILGLEGLVAGHFEQNLNEDILISKNFIDRYYYDVTHTYYGLL